MNDFKTSTRGTEISCMFYGVSEDILNDTARLKEILREGLAKASFRMLGELDYTFKPHGYTLAILLGESHAAIHTYPEYGSLGFSLHSCRSADDGLPVYEHLKRELKPTSEDFFRREVPIVPDTAG